MKKCHIVPVNCSSFLFVVLTRFFVSPCPSGVLSVPLSAVLRVEEDQSESAPAHARHEGGAHHPALCAHKVDQEND